MSRISHRFIFLLAIFFVSACNQSAQQQKKETDTTRSGLPARTKPAATYQDTLHIRLTSAVFYHPDTIQLEKIKSLTDSGMYEAQMHEFYYQMRNARMVIQKNYPAVRIIEAKNARYLLFRKSDSASLLMDLDTKNDPYGLFLFSPLKDPLFTDMMNIESQLSFYFPK